MVVLLWQRFVLDWDWPFHLAIGDKLFGTYRIAHRIGGLFVVCGCSILVCGYLGMSCFIRSCAISEALFSICMPRRWNCLPRRSSRDDNGDTPRVLMTRYCPYMLEGGA